MSARSKLVLFACLAGLGVAGAFLPVGHAEIDARGSGNSLEIRGSEAMRRLARNLAEQFMADHEGSIVTVESCGAHQGLKALIVGTCALAMGTDELPEDLEKLAKDLNVTLKRTDVYRDALVVVVHPSNPVRALSARALRDVFRGTVTNWKDVGGEDAPIEVLTPPKTSASYEVFKRTVLGADAVMTPAAVQVENKELREKLPASPHAIVYVGLAQYVRLNRPRPTNAEPAGKEPAKAKAEEAIEGEVKVDCASPPEAAAANPHLLAQGVSVDGVCPSTASVRDGSYPIVREMSLYQREPAAPLAAQVIEYFVGPKGQDLIRKDGNVPVN